VLRIRNEGTVRELNIPKEILQVLEKVQSSKVTEKTKEAVIKKLTGVSPCCICRGIPTLELRLPVHEGGATQIERYCNKCIERVYSRDAVL